MLLPTEALVAQVASKLKIIQHDTGATAPWVPNEEQGVIWEALARFALVYILKGRQIGATTAMIAWLLLLVRINDGAGSPVRIATVIDTDSKAAERFRVAKQFCKQLGFTGVKPNEAQLILHFPNGSEYVFMSAGSRRAGASGSFHFLHLTEVPFWRDVSGTMAALMQALLGGGRVAIETTMGVEDLTAKNMWLEQNGYRKIFFSYESHREYRRAYDPAILTADLEARLTRDGFKDREAMTDWAWRMQNMCSGDYVRCMREYPQLPEHSWAMAEGRWVLRTPEILKPVDIHPIESPSEVGLKWEEFSPPEAGCGYYLVVCDPAAGLGRDRSAVHVLDRKSRRIMASFSSEDVKFDDLCEVIQSMYFRYAVKLADGRAGTPSVLIETNGLGRGVHQHLGRLGLAPVEVHTDKVTRLEAMTIAKRYVEASQCFGPRRLAEECESLCVEDGDWKGPKDCLMALGMGLRWIASNPVPSDAPLAVAPRYQPRMVS